MQETINCAASERDLAEMADNRDVTVPRPLEVPGSVLTPPAGFTPDYFVNEFAPEPAPELVGYSAPAIERPGYRVQRFWNADEGVGVFIDHLSDEPFTVPEIRDLITTLTTALDDAYAEGPRGLTCTATSTGAK